MSNVKAVYTCITGGYDSVLIVPSVISDGFDYICFTDDPNMDGKGVWQIRPMPKETEEIESDVKKQRYVKINAHKVLPEYDWSIWVDGVVGIRGDVDDFFCACLMKGDSSIYVPHHQVVNCAYAEGKVCMALRKDTEERITAQLNGYKAEGFPINYGMQHTAIILRRHNALGCIRLMEAWWGEVKDKSHRDQISFSYAAWKNDDVKFIYLDRNTANSKWFQWPARGHCRSRRMKK